MSLTLNLEQNIQSIFSYFIQRNVRWIKSENSVFDPKFSKVIGTHLNANCTLIKVLDLDYSFSKSLNNDFLFTLLIWAGATLGNNLQPMAQSGVIVQRTQDVNLAKISLGIVFVFIVCHSLKWIPNIYELMQVKIWCLASCKLLVQTKCIHNRYC